MKTKQIKSAFSAAVIGVLSPLAMVLPASAATVNWSGYAEDSDSSTSNVANWFDAVPVDGDTVVFGVNGNYQLVNNDIGALSLAKLVFSGDNDFSSSKSYVISGNPLTLSSGIDAIMSGSGGEHQLLTSVTLAGDTTFKTTGSNSLTVGDTETMLDLGSNDLTLNAQGGTISLVGEIEGSGNIIKSGTSKVQLKTKPGSGGYSGGLNLSEGETSVDDNLGLNVTIDGGVLKGIGTVGTVTLNSGSIAPGASPGIINTSDLTLSGGSYEVELGGTADGEYDQTNVTGTVDLGSATELNLTLFGGYEPAVNDVFTIINNDGTDEVQGTFNGLANGDKVTLGEYTYQINYDAGDGNDVLVLVTGTPSAPDTGIGSIISSPLVTLLAALAALGVIGSLKYADNKRK